MIRDSCTKPNPPLEGSDEKMGTRVASATSEGIFVITLEAADGLPRLERAVLAQIESEIVKLSASREFLGCVITGTR